tara:strand:- start:401 stop:706 length:306 start_codon:yes stop_codon:yes gene_type:complete
MKIEMKPLSMIEAKKIVEASEEDNKETLSFMKKFIKITEKKAEELKKELEGLEMMKIKEEHIVKIIDLIPEDASDLNKIFTDVSLDENETNKLLETIKKHT